MLAGRDVPRLVVEALKDPANGDFELRSYADLDAWQKTIGPDARLPSMRRTLRESFADIRQGEEAVAQTYRWALHPHHIVGMMPFPLNM
jgi:hypothetical protein